MNTQTSNSMRHAIFSCISFFLFLNIAQAQEPTIATCQGDQYYCIDDSDFELCVEITLNPDFMAPIDHFEIDWGDGSNIASIPNSPNPIAPPHTYDLSGFYGSCTYQTQYFVTLTTFIVGDDPVVNIIPVYFRNPPQAIFSINPPVVCVGQQVCFNETACPATGFNIVSWNYGDGTSGLDPCHTYAQAGSYNITLTVENFCGIATTTHSLEVIEEAQAIAIPEPGYVDATTQPIIVCLEAGVSEITIPLNGDSLSTNETFYQWGNLNQYPCASWEPGPNGNNDPTPNIPDPEITFCDEGVYYVILQVDNACNIPSFDTLVFQVVSGEALGQLNQPDACLSLDYQPTPYNPNASYTINGVLQNTFPVTLGIGDYTVEGTLLNECGDQIVIDQFSVTAQPVVSIVPLSNDILCPGTAPVYLDASPNGGVWSGSANLIVINDSTFFNPNSGGEIANLTYTAGPPGCQDSESITITVEDGGFTANDVLICSWADDFQLIASPTPDNWFSVDCPSCVVNDSFIVSAMVAQGLTTVVVMFETDGSTSLCQSSGSLVVNLQDPVSSFLMDGTGCSNMLIAADASASVFDQPLIWTIDGIQGQTPPFNLSAGTYTIGLEAQLGSCTVSSSQSITVIAPPPPIAFTANPQEGCADLEVDLTVVGNSIAGVDYNWYVDGQLYSTDFDPANLILGQGLTDTTYTIEVGAANGCGGENLAQVITVHPKPIANFGTDQSEYCSGDTVWLGNASHGDPTAVFWDFGNGQTSTEYNPPYVMYFTSTTPTTYPVTLIAYNDCGTDTLTKDIPVNPTDVNAFFNTTPTTACVGEEICFENFSTFGAAIIFDFGDGNTTTNPNPCHSYAIPGIYEVSLKAFGCGFDSIFTMVEILPLPVVDVDISPISYCPGEEISFAASTDIVVDFFWAFGDNNTAALSNPQHSYTMPGTYQVKLTGTSLAGCAQSDSILITILQPPTADFAPATDSICTGESILFNNTSTNNVVSSYWEFGDGESSNEYSPSHIYENPGNYDVILVVTAGNSCPDTLMQLITVGAEPLPAFDTILNQQCTPVMVTFVNNSQNAESYEWDFGNGQTSTAANPTIIYDLGGIYAVQLTAVNGLCTRVEEQTIEVDQTPIPTTLLSDNTACAPASISFDAQEGSMLTSLNYAWDFGDGTFSFVQNVNHPYTVPGTYQVVLVVTNADSPICKDTVTEEVIIYEPVLITDTLTHILCNGASTGAIDIDPTSGTLPFAYDWSNGSVVQDQSALAAGNYVLVITDSNDCMLEEEFTLTEPAAIASITSDSSIVTCYGGDDGALCIAVSGGVADYDLQWSTGVAGACIEDVPASIYTVAITDANNCTVVDTFEVYQNPEIVLLDSVANISCYGADDGFILLQNISGGYSDFYNSVLTGPVDFNGGDVFTDLLPGDYHLLIQDLEGCTYEEDYTIGEPDSLWLDILEDSLFINMGDSIEIAVWHNAAQPVFNWSPTTGLNCPNCEDPWARPLRSTNYRVAMTDENGCPAGDIITIMVDPNRHFYIPNTFTPNGDGRNDLFRIRSRINSIRQINVFRVYDRWGELVFEAKDFRPQEENDRDAWDGTFRGRELPTETFTFYVEVAYIDGEEEVVEGTITLVR